VVTIIWPVSYKAAPVPPHTTAEGSGGQQQLADIPATARQLPSADGHQRCNDGVHEDHHSGASGLLEGDHAAEKTVPAEVELLAGPGEQGLGRDGGPASLPRS